MSKKQASPGHAAPHSPPSRIGGRWGPLGGFVQMFPTGEDLAIVLGVNRDLGFLIGTRRAFLLLQHQDTHRQPHNLPLRNDD